MTSMPGVVGPGTKIANETLNTTDPVSQSRIQASIDPIVLHFPKSRMLEIFKHTAKWRLGRLVLCLLPSS